MTEERFEEFLKRTLDELEPVPPAPREQMWAHIDQARRFTRKDQRKSGRRTWISWAVGFAAMLAVGIGIGRMTARQQAEIAPAMQTADISDVTPNRMTYQVAVNQHLNRAETVLTSFRTQSAGSVTDPQLAEYARELLSSTRLLLDSPAGDDPKIAALLSDLELILAQIARATDPSVEEREIIQDGLNRTAVLPRLRATTSVPAAAVT